MLYIDNTNRRIGNYDLRSQMCSLRNYPKGPETFQRVFLNDCESIIFFLISRIFQGLVGLCSM